MPRNIYLITRPNKLNLTNIVQLARPPSSPTLVLYIQVGISTTTTLHSGSKHLNEIRTAYYPLERETPYYEYTHALFKSDPVSNTSRTWTLPAHDVVRLRTYHTASSPAPTGHDLRETHKAPPVLNTLFGRQPMGDAIHGRNASRKTPPLAPYQRNFLPSNMASPMPVSRPGSNPCLNPGT